MSIYFLLLLLRHLTSVLPSSLSWSRFNAEQRQLDPQTSVLITNIYIYV